MAERAGTDAASRNDPPVNLIASHVFLFVLHKTIIEFVFVNRAVSPHLSGRVLFLVRRFAATRPDSFGSFIEFERGRSLASNEFVRRSAVAETGSQQLHSGKRQRHFGRHGLVARRVWRVDDVDDARGLVGVDESQPQLRRRRRRRHRRRRQLPLGAGQTNRRFGVAALAATLSLVALVRHLPRRHLPAKHCPEKGGRREFVRCSPIRHWGFTGNNDGRETQISPDNEKKQSELLIGFSRFFFSTNVYSFN